MPLLTALILFLRAFIEAVSLGKIAAKKIEEKQVEALKDETDKAIEEAFKNEDKDALNAIFRGDKPK